MKPVSKLYQLNCNMAYMTMCLDLRTLRLKSWESKLKSEKVRKKLRKCVNFERMCKTLKKFLKSTNNSKHYQTMEWNKGWIRILHPGSIDCFSKDKKAREVAID